MKPVVEKLPNGMRVVMVERHAAPVIAYQLWIGVGSADELPHQAGLAHVLEHMMFKGTERRRVGDIVRDVENAGGTINAWTSFDETVLHVTLASEFQDQGLDVLADAVMNSLFDNQELESELKVILEEIQMGKDQPQRVVTEDLFHTIFTRHPYGRPVIGTEERVRSFTREDLMAFYRQWYVPSNMVLVVCGEFDAPSMLQKIQNTFAGFQGADVAERSSRIAEPKQREFRFSHSLMPVTEQQLAIGLPIPGFLHEDVPALDVLAVVLGQGASSRLENTARRRLGLVNEIRTMSYNSRDTGVFGVFSLIQPRDWEAAMTVIFKELAKTTREYISSAEIGRAKILIESDAVYSQETVDAIARKLGYFELHANDILFEKKYLSALAQIGPEEVLSVAQKYLDPDKISIATVLPDPQKTTVPTGLFWCDGEKVNRSLLVERIRQTLPPPLHKKSKARQSSRPKTVVKTLSSGDTLIVQTDATAKLVAARAAFLGGGRLEPKTRTGLSCLLSALLTRGTNARSAEEISRTTDTLACSLIGFTGRNVFGLQGEFLASNFDQGFALMAECLRQSTFPEAELKREKELQIEEIKANYDNPQTVVFQLFGQSLFGTHPYGRPLEGTQTTVENLDQEILTQYHRAITGPGKMALSVVGGVDVDHVEDLVERHFVHAKLKGRAFRPPKQWTAPQTARQKVQHLPKSQSHLVIGFPAITVDSPDRFAAEATAEILGGHAGRLFAAIRERCGLAYAVTAVLMEGIDPGYLAIYCGTSPGREQQVMALVTDEIERLREQPINQIELKRVQRHSVGTRAIVRQRAAARATSMVLGHLYGVGYDAGEHYAEQIQSLKTEDITTFAQRYLIQNRMVVACVGPNANQLNLI